MPDNVEIKQFQLSDQEALLSFLRLAYPDDPRRSEAAFWQWQFIENPYVARDNIPLWVVKSDDQIVGQVAAIPVLFKLGNEERQALWIVDYVVLPEYRSGGIGIRLLQTSESWCPVSLTLGYNENAAMVMSRLKWKLLGRIHRYQILLFPGHAIQKISHFAPARHLANLLYRPLRPAAKKLPPAAAGAVRQLTQFDSSFDELWREASVQWPCAIVRSSRFLDWQFKKQPGKKYDILGYFEAERLLGYVVLFFRSSRRGAAPPKAAISDLCYNANNSSQIIDQLLQGALRLALERQAGSLVTDVLDERVEIGLRQLGFRHIKGSPPFAAKAGEAQELIHDRANWFLTRGDSDVSIFEAPNAG